MSKIKVAFFADCLLENYDGAIRTMYQIINRIDTSRFEYMFITGDRPKAPFPHKILEVPSVRIPFNTNYKIALSFLAIDSIEDALDEFQPDVIHLSTPSPLGHSGLEYAIKNNIPTLAIYHTHYLSYTDYYLEEIPLLRDAAKKFVQSTTRTFYNKCELVYVPTTQMINDLKHIGVFSNHLKIWKRGINTDDFSPEKADPEFIESLTKNKKKNILFASRLVWEKNLKTLIKINQEIMDNKLPYNLIIAGDGHARSKLENLMPGSFFVGHLSHEVLGSLYASADVFLFTSISETYGNVVAEAMASGLPCVIANGGGSKSFIKNGVNGFLVEPNDAHAYINMVGELINNKQLRDQFRTRGILQTRALSWDSLTDVYFEDIRHLSSKKMLLTA